MAPITLSTVDGTLHIRIEVTNSDGGPTDDLKEVIQHLFEIQSAVHGYLGPETQTELVRKMYSFFHLLLITNRLLMHA